MYNPKMETYPLVTIAAISFAIPGAGLEHFLECIHEQTYPKKRIILYFRTDGAAEQIETWISKNGNKYHKIFFHQEPLCGITCRKKGQVRQASCVFAHNHSSHYFSCNMNCFLIPETVESMVATRLPVVSPFLQPGNPQPLRGMICAQSLGDAYFIRRDILKHVNYLGTTEEDIISKEIALFLCTEKVFGVSNADLDLFSEILGDKSPHVFEKYNEK